jgi:hypothetical protein
MNERIKIPRGRIVLAALAHGDQPVLIAGLMAGSGLLLALLCAAGAP